MNQSEIDEQVKIAEVAILLIVKDLQKKTGVNVSAINHDYSAHRGYANIVDGITIEHQNIPEL